MGVDNSNLRALVTPSNVRGVFSDLSRWAGGASMHNTRLHSRGENKGTNEKMKIKQKVEGRGLEESRLKVGRGS